LGRLTLSLVGQCREWTCAVGPEHLALRLGLRGAGQVFVVVDSPFSTSLLRIAAATVSAIRDQCQRSFKGTDGVYTQASSSARKQKEYDLSRPYSPSHLLSVGFGALVANQENSFQARRVLFDAKIGSHALLLPSLRFFLSSFAAKELNLREGAKNGLGCDERVSQHLINSFADTLMTTLVDSQLTLYSPTKSHNDTGSYGRHHR
jgi:hypothetical protein